MTTVAGGRERDSDIRTRLDLLRRGGGARGAERGTLDRVRRAERGYRRELGAADDASSSNTATAMDGGSAGIAGANSGLGPGLLLAFAYPDRIAKRRAGTSGRYQLANGRGAVF